MLRYELIEAKKQRNETVASSIEDALKEAYDQLSGLAYIRPATTYLRSISAATVFQSDNGLHWNNTLIDNVQNVAGSFLGIGGSNPLKKDVHLEEIQSELDKQYWSNINKVNLSAGGKLNYVVAKDDIGNWYVKTYAADASQIFRSVQGLGLFALGGKIDFNLVDVLEREQELKSQIKDTTDSTRRDEIRGKLAELRKERPGAQDSSLGKVFQRYEGDYGNATRISATMLSDALKDDALKNTVASSWEKSFEGAVDVTVGGKLFKDVIKPKLDNAYTQHAQPLSLPLNKVLDDAKPTNEAATPPAKIRSLSAKLVETLNALRGFRDTLSTEIANAAKSETNSLAKARDKEFALSEKSKQDRDAAKGELEGIQNAKVKAEGITGAEEVTRQLTQEESVAKRKLQTKESDLTKAQGLADTAQVKLTKLVDAAAQAQRDVTDIVLTLVLKVAENQHTAAKSFETAAGYIGEASRK